jgi:hypothetical protein
MTSRILAWLRREDNRAIVKMAAAGLSAVCAGIWAVYLFMAQPQKSGAEKDSSQSVTATSGSVAAGRDAVGNTINDD